MTHDATPASHTLSDEAAATLLQVREAQEAMAQAARDTAMAADELRRHAKFARPGQPSPHVVQLRQKQARARVDSARAKQAFLVSAQAFVRSAGLVLPPQASLEAFVNAWIRRNTSQG